MTNSWFYTMNSHNKQQACLAILSKVREQWDEFRELYNRVEQWSMAEDFYDKIYTSAMSVLHAREETEREHSQLELHDTLRSIHERELLDRDFTDSNLSLNFF